MAVKKGDKVKVDYEGKLEDGTVFDSSKHGDHSHPLEFEVGSGMVIKGFDEGVVGMEINEEKEITIEPKDAYGDKKDDLMREVPKDKMPEGQEPKAGMTLVMKLPDGKQMPIKIEKVEGDKVTLDMNHPLAGKKLIFKVKLLEVN